MLPHRERGLWERGADWFAFGRGAAWRVASRCERCGLVVTDRSYTVLYRPQERGWWTVPGRLTRLLRQRRSVDPVPRFYAILAMAGTAAGLLARRTVGVRWWWGPVASVGAGWLWATSTAFFGTHAARRHLRR